MYNPITFVKDIIDILKDGGPGEAVEACVITPANMDLVIKNLGPRSAKYAIIGDFVVEFENTITIVPAKEFHKHYEFASVPRHDPQMPLTMTTVRTIKPL